MLDTLEPIDHHASLLISDLNLPNDAVADLILSDAFPATIEELPWNHAS